jgi:predicted  nucleic acid-binding Zn-ribbon protein
MALVERVHPKRVEYVCSGCNMSVTLEIVNALQSRDEVQTCQICSRILYFEVPASAMA